MDSPASVSASSLHSLIANVSGLFGVVVFLQQMLRGASLDHVLFTGTTSGLMAYLTLAVGYAAARRLITHSSSEESSDETAPSSSDQAVPEMETEDAQSVSDPQTA